MRLKLNETISITGRQLRCFCLLPLLVLILVRGFAFGATGGFPASKGAVNDFAGIIDSSYAQAMESLSREVLEKTGTSIVVAVMESIGDENPDDYANRLYQAWGVGKKGEDKGVLIFLALKERKIRMETGYGVEGILPDGLVGEILDGYVLPYLKKGEYGKGLENGVIAVASVIAKDARVTLSGAPAPSRSRGISNRRGTGLFPFIFLIPVLLLLIGTRRGRELLPIILLMLMSSGGRGGGGGGFGSFGGGFGGFGGGSSGGGGAGRSF